MRLEEFIDTIIDIAEELTKESIDYEKISVLYNLLNKLVEKYSEKTKSASNDELDHATFRLTFEMEILKSDKTKEVLDTLYDITQKEQKNRTATIAPNPKISFEKKALI